MKVDLDFWADLKIQFVGFCAVGRLINGVTHYLRKLSEVNVCCSEGSMKARLNTVCERGERDPQLFDACRSLLKTIRVRKGGFDWKKSLKRWMLT